MLKKNQLPYLCYKIKKPFDKVFFAKKGFVKKQYYFPESSGDGHQLLLNVSRTWNPKRFGVSIDNRDLGVAVSQIKFMDEMPEDGVGLYHWEELASRQIPGWPQGQPIKFRWTGMRASMNLESELKDGVRLFLLCAHPEMNKYPVRVKIIGNKGFIREEIFKDAKLKKVFLGAEEIKDLKVLTFQVSRTWNPKLAGVSEDFRDLGVAVAVLGP